MSENCSLFNEEVEDGLAEFGLSTENEEACSLFAMLSQRHKIPISSLISKYVAFQNNRGLSNILGCSDVGHFEKETFLNLVQQKAKRPLNNKQLNSIPDDMRKDLISSQERNSHSKLMLSYVEDIDLSSSPVAFNLATAEKHGENTEEATSPNILCSYSSLDISALDASFSQLCQIQSSDAQPVIVLHAETSSPLDKVSEYRYMYQRPLGKAEILDNWSWKQIRRILDCIDDDKSSSAGNASLDAEENTSKIGSATTELSQVDSVLREAGLTTLSLRPVHSRLQTPSLVAGRVAVCPTSGSCGELKPTVARLHPSNACLIGTRRAGGGEFSRAILDLKVPEYLNNYSLFPGQPVVLKATNFSGRSLTVLDVYQVPLLPFFDVGQPSSDIHIAIACGIFTSHTSSAQSVLFGLLRALKMHRPHVLIIMGPLVDVEAPDIVDYIETTYDELARSRLNTIAEWCFLLKTSLVVVSSYREADGNPVYPTPPPSSSWSHQTPELASWYKNVTFVWDPCMLKIGHVVVCVSSPDVLFQLSSEEISLNSSGDRLARLCRHILASGCVYPVHPPAADLPLDYPLWNERAQFGCLPHCLVLPSRLRCFIKNVEGVICVNPGFVSRLTGGMGSFARLFFPAKCNSFLPQPGMTVENASVPRPPIVDVLGEVVSI